MFWATTAAQILQKAPAPAFTGLWAEWRLTESSETCTSAFLSPRRAGAAPQDHPGAALLLEHRGTGCLPASCLAS